MTISSKIGSMTIEQTIVKITLDEQLELKHARQLRGVFAGRYPNRFEFHGHGPRGLVYEHPRIQFKVVGGQALIVGLQEGSFLLQGVDIPAQLRLGAKWFNIIHLDRIVSTVPFGLAEMALEYKFVTPWVALNEKNHARLREAHLQGKLATKAFMRQILIGNLLSASKAWGYEVSGPIEAEVDTGEPMEVILKPGVGLLGFLGEFRTNFAIPPLWGIGKQSARGFGTVEKIA